MDSIFILIGFGLILAISIYVQSFINNLPPFRREEETITMRFKKDIPHDLTDPLYTMKSTNYKSFKEYETPMLFLIPITALIFRFSVHMLILTATIMIGIIFSHKKNPVSKGSSKVYLYENAILHVTSQQQQIWYLDEIDSLSSFKEKRGRRSIYYGYRIESEKGGFAFDHGFFDDVNMFEDIYANNPYIEEVICEEIPGWYDFFVPKEKEDQ